MSEDCTHEKKDTLIYSTGEIEESCEDCGAYREGFIAWGDWEEKPAEVLQGAEK